MGFIQNDQFIETFFTDASYPTFSISVSIGSPNRRKNNLDVFRCKNCIKRVCELAIAVVNEKAQWWRAFLGSPDELPGLLRHPVAGGMRGTTGEVDTSSAKFDEEEHVQRLQKQGLNGEEVTGNELMFVRGHKFSPTQRRATLGKWWYAVTFEDVGDSLIADFQPQFAQFSLDLAVPPIIGTGKSKHQAFHADAGAWTSTRRSMPVGSFPPNQFTMPFEDGFGLEDADHVA